MDVVLAFEPFAQTEAPRVRERPILDTLHPADAATIRAAARRVWLPAGDAITRIGAPLDHVWFPEDAVVSVAERLTEGRHADLALIGAEGVVGWQALLGDTVVAWRCVVELGGGHALVLPAAMLRAMADERPGLRRALLAYVSVFSGQVARTLSSTLHCPPDVRLARWLLLMHDRMEGDVLAITHQRLADLLGVRRATITDWLHLLEGERLVRCTRGRVAIRDRDGLIRLTGTAYGGVGGTLAAARRTAPAAIHSVPPG